MLLNLSSSPSCFVVLIWTPLSWTLLFRGHVLRLCVCCDTSSPSEPCSLILELLCFIDVILDFIFTLILYRFLLKFLLLLSCSLVRVCCQLPPCSVCSATTTDRLASTCAGRVL